MKKRELDRHFLVLLIILFAFIVVKLPLLSNAALDRNLVRTFDTDEYSAIVTVEKGLNQNFKTDFYYYGNLYPFLTAVTLLPNKISGRLNDQMITIALRALSLVFFVLAVLFLYRFGARFFSRMVGFLSACLLLLTTEGNHYSTIAHADTLQMFLVVSCFYFLFLFITSLPHTSGHDCSKEDDAYSWSGARKYLILAAFTAGLSFSTKYIGIFILPTLVLGSALREGLKISRWRIVLYDSVLIGLCFLVGFVSTSPYHIIHLDQFARAIKITTFWVTKAFVYELSPNPFLWFSVLQKTDLLGPALFYLVAICVLYYAVSLYNKAVRGKAFELKEQQVALLAFWILSFFAYIFVRIRLREARYLLPLIPFMYILVAVAVTDFWSFIQRHHRGYIKAWLLAFGVGSAVFVVIGIKENVSRALYLHRSVVDRPNAESVKAGLWLAENFTPSSSIFFDNYSYIPKSFEKITGSYGMFEDQKRKAAPDVIVVHRAIFTRYDSIQKAEKYAEGPKRGMEIHTFYKDLFEGRTEFEMVKDFNEVKIFKKRV